MRNVSERIPKSTAQSSDASRSKNRLSHSGASKFGPKSTNSCHAVSNPSWGLAQLPLCVGSVMTVMAIFMTSLCEKYHQLFLAQGTLLGVGMVFVLLPSAATIPRYFVKHRGLALGITVSGSSLGGVVWPILLEQLLNVHHLSFGWTMRIVGFTMLTILPAAWIILRPPQTAATTRLGANTEQKKESHVRKIDLSVAKDWTFLTMCMGLTVCYFGFFIPFFSVTSYAPASVPQQESPSISFQP